MNLEVKLIAGFILHFVGDYLLQNDWMAADIYLHNLKYLL